MNENFHTVYQSRLNKKFISSHAIFPLKCYYKEYDDSSGCSKNWFSCIRAESCVQLLSLSAVNCPINGW